MNGERGEAQLARWRHMSLSKVMRNPACRSGYTNPKDSSGNLSSLKLEESEIQFCGEKTPMGAAYQILFNFIKV